MAGTKGKKGQPGREGQGTARIGPSAYEWVSTHEVAARSAANLRISGMSEKAVLREMRKAYPDEGGPSYNKLRAAWKTYGIETKAKASVLRKQDQRIAPDGQRRNGSSQFLERRRASFSEPQKLRLEHNFTIAYLANEGAFVHEDGDLDIDWLRNELEGS